MSIIGPNDTSSFHIRRGRAWAKRGDVSHTIRRPRFVTASPPPPSLVPRRGRLGQFCNCRHQASGQPLPLAVSCDQATCLPTPPVPPVKGLTRTSAHGSCQSRTLPDIAGCLVRPKRILLLLRELSKCSEMREYCIDCSL